MIKKFGVLLAAASIVFVAGCNRGGNNSTANKTAPANTTNTAAAPAPAPAPAPAAGGAPVDAAMLTSHPWGRAGCADSTTFNPDGTMQDKDGPGTWTLQGNTLTVTQGGQQQPALLSRNGDNLVAANPANPAQTLTLTACPADAGGAAPAAEGADDKDGE